MGRKCSCSQYTPLSVPIPLDLATGHWFGAMASGQQGEATPETSNICRIDSRRSASKSPHRFQPCAAGCPGRCTENRAHQSRNELKLREERELSQCPVVQAVRGT